MHSRWSQAAHWKAHPYLDTEVLEWARRVEAAKSFLADPCESIQAIKREESRVSFCQQAKSRHAPTYSARFTRTLRGP